MVFSKYIQKGNAFLGTEFPLICGAMTWISNAQLVSAVCNNGAFGCLAGGNMPEDLLSEEIVKTRQLTNRAFGVNLITITPNYKAHLKMVSRMGVPFIIFAGSFPRASEVRMAKESGAKVLCFASTDSIAERMIEAGADGLILEGSEAGGHIGHVSLTILIQQVLFPYRDKLPIFVAGGIATGQMAAHMFLMGAAGIQMGTRFVMTDECTVHPNFKKAFVSAKARDAVATPQLGSELHVVAVRALKNKAMLEFSDLQLKLIEQRRRAEISQQEAQYTVERFWIGGLRRAAIDGDIATGSVMAGQSVGLMNNVSPVAEVIAKIKSDAETELFRALATTP